ncbi:MAG: TetR/AcrR family transcriptional regulator [Phycisphaerae bacterium]
MNPSKPSRRGRPVHTAADLFVDGSHPQNTRDRLIEQATELFYAQGIHATGLDQILRAVGISKQAFYKHFPSKEDLAVEAIKMRDARELNAFLEQVAGRAGPAPRDQLLAAFDVINDWFNDPKYEGCIFLTACAEFPQQHDPVHQAGKAHYTQCETLFTRVAERAGADDPAALAKELVLLIEGAMIYRLICGDNAAAAAARKLAEHAVNARTGPPATTTAATAAATTATTTAV